MSRLDVEAALDVDLVLAGELGEEGQEAVTGRPSGETATGRPGLAGRTAPGKPGWGGRVATGRPGQEGRVVTGRPGGRDGVAPGRPVQGGLGCGAEEVITFISGWSLGGGYGNVTGMWGRGEEKAVTGPEGMEQVLGSSVNRCFSWCLAARRRDLALSPGPRWRG